MTGYLDVLLHFALECTISGAGRLREARFQAGVALGLERRITYLRKSKSMAEDLSWRGARRPLKKKKSVKPVEKKRDSLRKSITAQGASEHEKSCLVKSVG